MSAMAGSDERASPSSLLERNVMSNPGTVASTIASSITIVGDEAFTGPSAIERVRATFDVSPLETPSMPA